MATICASIQTCANITVPGSVFCCSHKCAITRCPSHREIKQGMFLKAHCEACRHRAQDSRYKRYENAKGEAAAAVAGGGTGQLKREAGSSGGRGSGMSRGHGDVGYAAGAVEVTNLQIGGAAFQGAHLTFNIHVGSGGGGLPLPAAMEAATRAAAGGIGQQQQQHSPMVMDNGFGGLNGHAGFNGGGGGGGGVNRQAGVDQVHRVQLGALPVATAGDTGIGACTAAAARMAHDGQSQCREPGIPVRQPHGHSARPPRPPPPPPPPHPPTPTSLHTQPPHEHGGTASPRPNHALLESSSSHAAGSTRARTIATTTTPTTGQSICGRQTANTSDSRRPQEEAESARWQVQDQSGIHAQTPGEMEGARSYVWVREDVGGDLDWRSKNTAATRKAIRFAPLNTRRRPKQVATRSTTQKPSSPSTSTSSHTPPALTTATALATAHAHVHSIIEHARRIVAAEDTASAGNGKTTLRKWLALNQIHGPLGYATIDVDGTHIKRVDRNRTPDVDIPELLLQHRVLIVKGEQFGELPSFGDKDALVGFAEELVCINEQRRRSGGPQDRRAGDKTNAATWCRGGRISPSKAAPLLLEVTDHARIIGYDQNPVEIPPQLFLDAARARVEGMNSLDIFLNRNVMPKWTNDVAWSLPRYIEQIRVKTDQSVHDTFGRAGRLTNWILLGLGSSHSLAHEDECGLDTVLHLLHGRCVVGFCKIESKEEEWLWREASRVIQDESDGGEEYWRLLRGMTWVHTIVEAGETILFRGGTVHYVSRFPSSLSSASTDANVGPGLLRDGGPAYAQDGGTVIVGGHIKRICVQDIEDLLTQTVLHARNPNMTNADVMLNSIPKALQRFLELLDSDDDHALVELLRNRDGDYGDTSGNRSTPAKSIKTPRIRTRAKEREMRDEVAEVRGMLSKAQIAMLKGRVAEALDEMGRIGLEGGEGDGGGEGGVRGEAKAKGKTKTKMTVKAKAKAGVGAGSAQPSRKRKR